MTAHRQTHFSDESRHSLHTNMNISSACKWRRCLKIYCWHHVIRLLHFLINNTCWLSLLFLHQQLYICRKKDYLRVSLNLSRWQSSTPSVITDRQSPSTTSVNEESLGARSVSGEFVRPDSLLGEINSSTWLTCWQHCFVLSSLLEVITKENNYNSVNPNLTMKLWANKRL